MYDGYIYDYCSWGVTVHYKNGESEEFYFNDYFNREEFWVMLDNNNIAPDYETYKNSI